MGLLAAVFPHIRRSGRRSVSNVSYIHGASKKQLSFQTIHDIVRNSVEKKPDKEFVIFRHHGVRKTFEDMYNDSRKLAAGFYGLGLERGDRVGVWGHNYYEWVVCQFATAMAGMIQVNINPAYKAHELHYALQTVGVKALVTPKQFRSSNYMQLLNDVCHTFSRGKPGDGALDCPNLPDLKHVIVFGEDEPVKGCWSYNDIFNGAGSDAMKQVDEAIESIRPDEAVNIQYTSGTTGYPKAATLTHLNIINNARFVGERSMWNTKDVIACIPNPLYHCFGCVLGVANAMIHQQTCVFPEINYKVEKVLEAIQEEKCNYIFGTPTMFIDLLTSKDFKKYDLSSVYGGYIAGAPCSPPLCAAMQKKLGMKELFILYGSTELSPIVTMSVPSEPPEKRIKSVGHVMPHTEIVIVDAEGKAVPKGEKGELLARGYMTMLGYWGDEARTKKDITSDRWYHTGDTAVMNEDGSIKIVGRTKDMICRGGENIYPTEIEQFMHSLPYIADVQVIGVPDERLGEAVCAWVRVTHDAGNITEEKIKEDCKDKIATFKIPKYILIKEEKDFPMTATGKVKKFELRDISKKLLKLETVQTHFNI